MRRWYSCLLIFSRFVITKVQQCIQLEGEDWFGRYQSAYLPARLLPQGFLLFILNTACTSAQVLVQLIVPGVMTTHQRSTAIRLSCQLAYFSRSTGLVATSYQRTTPSFGDFHSPKVQIHQTISSGM